MVGVHAPSLLFVVRKYPPEHSGDGLLVHHLARHLAALSHRVGVACVHPGEGEPRPAPGVQVLAAPRPAAGGLRGRRLALHARALAAVLGPRRWDVLISMGGDPLLLPVLLAARGRGLGVVHRTSLVGSDDADSIARTRAGRALLGTLRGVDARIVCVTDVFRPGFERRGFAPERLEVLHPGVDVEAYRPAEAAEKDSLRRSLGLAGDPLFCFVGGVIHRKGIDLLARAWPLVLARHPGARLVLVGPFDRDSAFFGEVIATLRAAGAEGSVTFAGPQADPSPWVRAADAFAFPSRQEGFGMAPLEGMAAGLPVVMTRFEGLSDALGRDGEEHLLAELDAPSLADGMCRIAEDPALRARLVARGRPWVEARFAYPALAERLSRICAGAAAR
ncbi:glycosyltransferase family 4 protein [Myxococcota bacterium]|nr:glycosyltransferase family 4 protein [Myxococcota bacterium]